LDHQIRRVDLVPTNATEIGARSVFVVVVVIAFTHHQEVHREEILGCVAHFEVPVAVFMGKPVDDGAVDGAHEELYRKEQPQPPLCGKCRVNCNVDQAPHDPRRPGTGETVEGIPAWYAACKSFVDDHLVLADGGIDRLRLPHHVPDGFVV